MKRCSLKFEHRYLNGLTDRIEKEHDLWVSTGTNEITGEVEEYLKNIIGREIVVVNSGTSAILTSLLLLKIEPEDKVAISNYGYPAAINCIKFLGAKPVFVDIKRDTLCIDPNELADKIKGTKAVICIENNGYVGDHLNEIKKVCINYRIPLIEDSCASFGQKSVGLYGSLATLSFGPTKIIGCGEGGAIILDSKERKRVEDIIFKLNFRLSPILQYILLQQLKEFDSICDKRKQLKDIYKNNQIELFPGSGAGFISKNPEMLSNMLRRADVEFLHQYYPYQVKTDIADDVFNRFFDLPLHNNLSREDINKISAIVRITEK